MRNSAVHEGHRGRMRKRIRENGLESLREHEVLEYLLYAYVPRKDTNELAHNLIDEFGSFENVLNADEKWLAKVSGVTENAALFLSSLPDVFRLYALGSSSEKMNVKGRGRAKEYLNALLFNRPCEHVYIAALDGQDNMLSCKKLSEGSGDTVALSIREAVDFALKYRASRILLAHNHPSGSVKPSQADVDMTKEIAWTLHGIGVKLEDHYIFGTDMYFSFEEAGYLEKFAKQKRISLKEGNVFYEY